MEGLRATSVARVVTGGRVALLLCAWLCGACAGPLVESGDDQQAGFTHRKLGYSIAAPRVEASVWRRFDLDGADLAYRDRRGSVMSLASRCRTTQASVAALARHVTIGTERTELLSAGPFELAGAEGWTQTFDTDEEGVRLRVKAVTLLVRRCIYDWLLVVRRTGDFDSAEAVFDDWIASFEPPVRSGPAVPEAPSPSEDAP